MSGQKKQWPKLTRVRQPLVVTAAEIPDKCPECGNRVLGRTADGDVACICGNVIYVVASYEPATRDGLRKAMAI
jgi:ribosomal protein L37AE/L43A